MPLPAFILPAAGAVIDKWGGNIIGKKSKSSCRTVSDSDLAAFKRGTVSPHVLWERLDDIKAAIAVPSFVAGGSPDDQAWAWLGASPRPATWDAAIGTPAVARLAEIHLSVFVPLCQNMEGGKYTTDPHSGEGLALYESARAQFREQVRSGQLRFNTGPTGSASHNPYGERGPGGGSLPSEPFNPATRPMQAGGLALAAGAVVLLLFAARG